MLSREAVPRFRTHTLGGVAPDPILVTLTGGLVGPEIHLAHLVGKLTVYQTTFVLAKIVDTSLVVVAIRVFFAPTLKK